MATVTPKTKTITTLNGFEIFLTNEEAFTLYLILRSVGGDPNNTARRYTSELHDMLAKAFDKANIWCQQKYGEIYFQPGSKTFVEANCGSLSTKLQ